MAEAGQSGAVTGLVKAVDVASAATLRRTANGIRWTQMGETQLADADLSGWYRQFRSRSPGRWAASLLLRAAGAGRGEG